MSASNDPLKSGAPGVRHVPPAEVFTATLQVEGFRSTATLTESRGAPSIFPDGVLPSMEIPPPPPASEYYPSLVKGALELITNSLGDRAALLDVRLRIEDALTEEQKASLGTAANRRLVLSVIEHLVLDSTNTFGKQLTAKGLAQLCDRGTATIYRALGSLADAGLVTWDRQAGRHAPFHASNELLLQLGQFARRIVAADEAIGDSSE